MQSRVERNRSYRRNKRRVRMFLVLAVILVGFSLYQVNRSYNELVGEKAATQMIGVRRDEDNMKIIVLGEQIKISQDYINQSKEILRGTSNKIVKFTKKIMKKASSR